MEIFHKLIEQSKLPSGRLGRMMLRIMNNAHRGLTIWGLSLLQPCQKILDISCGGGNAIFLMAKTGKYERIYGVDLSPDAVALATAKNRKYIEDGLVAVSQASVLQLPFADDFFGAATTFQSHYHWPDILAAMQEVYRVLQPGGQFVLVAEIYKITYHMEKYNDVEQTVALFKDSGFRNIELLTNQKHICVSGYK